MRISRWVQSLFHFQMYENPLLQIILLVVVIFEFLSRPVIIEVPHFASLRGQERDILILRSDDGETWKEHRTVSTDKEIQDVLDHSFEGDGVYTAAIVSDIH